MYNIEMLPKEKKQWVLWKREEVKKLGIPTGEFTKVPYSLAGRKASSINKTTWATHKEVSEKRHLYDGIGFVLDGSYLGVDLDHVLVSGKIKDKLSENFVENSNTLTEISPSGDGLHLYFKISEPIELKANSHKPNEIVKYECYTQKRYLTVTENIFENKNTIRTIGETEAIRLLKILGYPWGKSLTVINKTSDPSNSGLLTKNKLSDESLLRIMFSARNGQKMREIYDGSDSYNDNDTSAADASLCSMFAFYSNKDFNTIERLWLASPRGKREKVQKRADYRKMTIEYAVQKTEEVFSQKKNDDGGDEEYDYYVVQEGKKGETVIPVIVENIRYFLNTHKDFKGCFRFEEFKQIIEYKLSPDGDWRQVRDEDILFVMNKIARAHPYFSRVSKEMVSDAMLAVSKQYSYDEVRQYMTSLVWDKKPRIDIWLCTVFGVDQNEYHKKVGANWLKGLVKRAIEPGSKFDYVLVIEGAQGIKKSTSFSILASPWHSETVTTPDNKDFFMNLVGNLVVEFAEGESLTRGEMKRLKAVITMTHDDIRLPYARLMSRHPRRCVFAMTTNEEQYLKDNTGNRRWLPVKAVKDEADVEWLKENRDQLFAEAYYRVIELKETFWEFPKEDALREQAARVINDPREELIFEWYAGLSFEEKASGVTTRQAFEGVKSPIGSFGATMNKADEMAIASILKNSLFLIRCLKMNNGVQKSVFIPSDKTPVGTTDTKIKEEINKNW